MNAKKLKALRREAEKQTIGMPKSNLIPVVVGQRLSSKYGMVDCIIMINDPKTTRGVYRKLKKAA